MGKLNNEAAFCREIEDQTAKVLKIDWTDEEDAFEPIGLDSVKSEPTSSLDV